MRHYLRWIFISSIIGIISGLTAFMFIVALNWATITRENNLKIIYLLPFAGFFSGWIYHYWLRKISDGTNLIIEEMQDPKKVVPIYMAPFILITSTLTHLFGGSAGREGAIVQMGASLADQLSYAFKLNSQERKILLTAGTGAAFGAALGTPWAGVIFGMEVIQIERIKIFAVLECIIASFVGYYTTQLLKVPHTYYPVSDILTYSINDFVWVLFAGIIFGVTARIFVNVTHLVERVNSKLIRYPPLRPFFAGIILVFIFSFEQNRIYMGLGINSVQLALQNIVNFDQPTLKLLFSTLTIGSGFKGGEFIPLVFIGTTLGSALSILIPISFKLLATLGFAAVFAGAANTPIACSVMAIEIFGIGITPYVFSACFISYLTSGHHGIYKGQKYHQKKYHRLMNHLKFISTAHKKKLSRNIKN